ncbi:maltose alpha-D-glucosyltransferase [candidate division KSB1 bacterium]|nr:maltose alpha-D-glucosyltransferase [candidate division KSB1 bacterium]
MVINASNWYKDAIIYELHVKSFCDSDGDGIGDFRGLLMKLDYLESLGITALWLLPFYPSPLRDDGYDISDYRNIHPDYGNLRDFKRFLKAAHERGIRVITELVVNHTSDQHPWFQRARQAKPGSVFRDYYVWSDTPDKYQEARIIFKDFEASNWTWDPQAKAYYWHRFYSHQPDLNFDNPRVQKEIIRIMDYWFDMGVDGMRLDAIPYLYEQDGTNCENLPETHAFLKKLRAHVDRKHENKIFIAEANQWPEDATAYFGEGEGDECHMAFHFPVMPRLFMSVQMEDRFPIMDILEQTPEIPEKAQWAMFLRNHDELTLEMVTDEERDYMYRVFAEDAKARINLGIRRRLAPLLNNNRRKIELMNIMLLSLPGTPVIYYGDEIGMGDNYYLGDRDGVRTPMQWSSDRNAGFSRANPQKLFLPVIIDPEYHFESLNVENQERNPSSTLWWMKRVIEMRKRFKSFSRGSLTFYFPDNPKVLVFTRQYKDEIILVVINLSRFTQVVELHLPEFENYYPEEIFSQNRFPQIPDQPYLLTLGPHGHYWLNLIKESEPDTADAFSNEAEIKVRRKWTEIFGKDTKVILEKEKLPQFLESRPWFRYKAKNIRNILIRKSVPFTRNNHQNYVIVIADVTFSGAQKETFLLPLAFVNGDEIDSTAVQHSLSKVFVNNKRGIVIDALYDDAFGQMLVKFLTQRKRQNDDSSDLTTTKSRFFKRVMKDVEKSFSIKDVESWRNQSVLIFENDFRLKFFHRMEDGKNPEPEILKFLSDYARFENIPTYVAEMQLKRGRSETFECAVLQKNVHCEGDAWSMVQDGIGQYFDRVLSKNIDINETGVKRYRLVNGETDDIPDAMYELLGSFQKEQLYLLGKRTAELHLALASSQTDQAFRPEPFSKLYQRALYQTLRTTATRGFTVLQKNIYRLEGSVQEEAHKLLLKKQDIIQQFKEILNRKIIAMKIRVNGDLHLKRVLYTGKDFVISDFVGEPDKTASQKRLKYPSIRDVACMMRSFHYAAYNALFQYAAVRPKDSQILEQWIYPWHFYMSNMYLRGYLESVSDTQIVPQDRSQLNTLLQVISLEKTINELVYELDSRPEWVIIPIKGILHILEDYQL